MIISVCVAGSAFGLSVMPLRKTSAVYLPLLPFATAGEESLIVRFFGRPRFFGIGCAPSFFFVPEAASAEVSVSHGGRLRCQVLLHTC
jgi:hypothetical protein